MLVKVYVADSIESIYIEGLLTTRAKVLTLTPPFSLRYLDIAKQR